MCSEHQQHSQEIGGQYLCECVWGKDKGLGLKIYEVNVDEAL